MVDLRKYLIFYRYIYVILAGATLLALFSVINGNKVLAFSTTTPLQASAPATNSANIYGSGTNIQPWFAVGVGAYDGPNSYVKVYVPKGQTAILTVIQGNGVCGIDVGNPSVGYLVTKLDNAETILGSAGSLPSKSNSGACGPLSFTLSGGTPATKLIGHGNYDVYYFEASITNGANSGDNEKNFRLSVSNGLIGVSRAVKNYGAKPWFGIYMRDAPSMGGTNWDYAVQYSPYCNESSNPSSTVAVHDIDWQVYNQPNLSGLVDKDTRASIGYNWSLAPPGRPSSMKVTNDWPSGNDTDSSLTFTYNNDYRYLLEFRDIDWHNTIQISLPFDEFDSQPAVGQACNNPPPASTTCVATPNPSSIPLGSSSSISVVGTITAGSWPNTYYLERTGPSYRQITNGGNNNGTDSVTPSSTTTYTYVIYDSTTGKQASNSSSCQATVTVGKPPPPPGTASIDATCEQTTIRTNQIPGKWHPGGGAAQTITQVPVVVVITDNNNPSNTFSWIVQKNGVSGVPNGGSVTVNTFDMWNGMWPHGSYTVQVAAEGTSIADDSLTYQNNGFWNPTNNANNAGYYYSIQKFNTDSFSGCMQAAYCNGTMTAPDLEPGQQGTASATFHFDNNAGRSSGWVLDGSDNGYTFVGSASPGAVMIGGNPLNGGGQTIGAWNGSTPNLAVGTDINVPITIRLDWTGTYTITLQWQGNTISLPPSNSSISCQGSDTPASRSFFQVTGGDLAAGGGFAPAGGGQCALNDPGYISPATPGADVYYGGIRAYGNQSQGLGSKAEFGVLSLGYNIGSVTGPTGLFSVHQSPGLQEMFAQAKYSSYMGGLLNPSGVSSWHCVEDYFNDTQDNSTPQSSFGGSGTLTGKTGQWTSSGAVTLGASTIAAGQQVTLYVNGNLTINGDITYPLSWDATTQSNVPYVSVIVKGNIIVTSAVTRLDGLYVVQPTNATDGTFATCDSFCPLQLIVNGAVITQKVALLREHGTLGPLTADNNHLCDPTGWANCPPAEIFNYSPAMVIGQPAFANKYSKVESIFNLPPVF